VWLHGDVGWGPPAGFWPAVDRLNGEIDLITGNHDAPWPGNRAARRHQREWLEHFASVQPFAVRRLAGQKVLLSHFPYSGDHSPVDRCTEFRLRDRGLWVLHGHTHGTERRGPRHPGFTPHGGTHTPAMRQVHVGLDAWDLAPVPASELERIITAETAWTSMVAAGQELGEIPPRVCVTHQRVNVCRAESGCAWSEDPADVEAVSTRHAGTP
jgi:calcineurin-like phosphoesterase family protein